MTKTQKTIETAFKLFNLDAEMEWNEIVAILKAYLAENSIKPDYDYYPGGEWDDAFDKTANNMAVGKSYNMFYEIICKFFIANK